MVQAMWKKIAASASIQRSSQTLNVIAERAYIYGGELRPREPVDAHVYTCALESGAQEPQVLSATAKDSPTPKPRVGAASTVLNNKLYVFSGRGGVAMAPVEEHGSFWVLNPSMGGWSQLGPDDRTKAFPASRSYHALSNDGRDTIFLHAGCPETGRLRDLWTFSISERQWTEHTPAPGPERGGTSIAFAGGKLYRMNGFDGKTEQGGAIDVFDPASNSWTTISFKPNGVSGPTPRSVGCLLAVMIEKRWHLVTAFGESDPSNLGHQGAGRMLDDVWVFDLENEKWKKVELDGVDIPDARGWFGADVANDESLVIQGGLSESNERLGDMWKLQF